MAKTKKDSPKKNEMGRRRVNDAATRRVPQQARLSSPHRSRANYILQIHMYLYEWVVNQYPNRLPSAHDKAVITRETNLTESQVNNWFQNFWRTGRNKAVKEKLVVDICRKEVEGRNMMPLEMLATICWVSDWMWRGKDSKSKQ